MTRRNASRLTPLLNPRSIAIVGARPQAGVSGNNVLKTCRRGAFAGDVWLVNPTVDAIDGVPCYPSLRDVPGPVDVAALIVGNTRIEAVFRDAAAAGVQAAVIYGSCMTDDDMGSAAPLRERIRERARAHDIAICGINCAGFMNRDAGVSLQLQDIGDHTPGSASFLSQSGSVYAAVVHNDGELRFNLTVSTGQETTVDLAEYMDYALDLPSTRTLGLFIETVRDPAGFVAALGKAAEKDIPVVVLKVARTDRSKRFALSHSGAIAGEDSGFDAVFRKYGVLRVDDMDAMLATLKLMNAPKRPANGGLVAITDSGGERELLTDVAEAAGVPLTEIGEATRRRLGEEVEYGVEVDNPLDPWNSGFEYERVFRNGMDILLGDDGAAMGLWLADLHDDIGHFPVYVRAAGDIAAGTEKPLAFASTFAGIRSSALRRRLGELGIPYLGGITSALAAIRHAFDYRDSRRRRRPRPERRDTKADIGESAGNWRTRLGKGATLAPADSMRLLADFGIPAVATRFVAGDDAVRAVADEIGYPVALKTANPAVLHKTERGGVALALADAARLSEAYTAMSAALGPDVQVSAMVPGGPEIAFGLVRDPLFGPLVMAAAGGTEIERHRDAVFALPPFDEETAHILIDGLAIRPVLDGFRGRPAADVDALAHALARFSILVDALGDSIAEIDINPIIVGPDGVVAVDALVIGAGDDDNPDGRTEP